jgi:redox-sensitive bicupin YhaK (pirin superfamily)
VFVDVTMSAGTAIPLDPDYEERAIYIVDGEIEIAGETFSAPRLLVFRPGDRIAVHARTDAHIAILGGAALEGPRHIWWNFVSSRQDRIEQAKQDWKTARFDIVPGDEVEFIPLPDR